jgi:Ca2+-binding RTX toxin-like protein
VENLTITLDNTANDGAPAPMGGGMAENDNVMADISIILCGAGDDKVTGTTTAHAETMFGGAGADSLDGAAGNDELNGDAGGDSLTGGAGQDVINGGSGDDMINCQDMNTVDTVDGGIGTDSATRDLVDIITNVENLTPP